jgi:hypothetical protein
VLDPRTSFYRPRSHLDVYGLRVPPLVSSLGSPDPCEIDYFYVIHLVAFVLLTVIAAIASRRARSLPS